MGTIKFHRFFDWANSGAAAASLAFFGLLLSTEVGKSGIGLVATGFFLCHVCTSGRFCDWKVDQRLC